MWIFDFDTIWTKSYRKQCSGIDYFFVNLWIVRIGVSESSKQIFHIILGKDQEL